MIYLAYKNLFQQKFRLALSIGGAALAMMLIVLLNSFLSGIYVQIKAYLDYIHRPHHRSGWRYQPAQQRLYDL